MTEREKLIEELEEMTKDEGDICLECIADFILEDRKRIVEPLVKLGSLKTQQPPTKEKLIYAIDETLKLAGVE